MQPLLLYRYIALTSERGLLIHIEFLLYIVPSSARYNATSALFQ